MVTEDYMTYITPNELAGKAGGADPRGVVIVRVL